MEKIFWYAVMQDREDSDWGYGSFSLAEARRMMEAQKSIGYNDAYIAIIDGDYDEHGNAHTDPVCVDEIDE